MTAIHNFTYSHFFLVLNVRFLLVLNVPKRKDRSIGERLDERSSCSAVPAVVDIDMAV